MKIFSMAILLSSNFALAYVLPKEEVGFFFYASGVIAIIGALSTFGITILPVRFASAYWDENKSSSLRGLVAFTFAGSAFSSIAVAALVFAWSLVGSSAASTDSFTSARLTIILCIVTSNFQGLLLSYGRSLEWHGTSQFVELIAKPLALVSAIALLWMNQIDKRATSVLAIQFGAIASACVLQAAILFWHARSKLSESRALCFHREWLSYCGAGFVQSFVGSCAINIEIFVLGIIATGSDTATFGLAYRATSGLSFFRNIGGIIAAPRYLRLARTSANAQAYVLTGIKHIFFPTLLCAVILVAAAVVFSSYLPVNYDELTYALLVLALAPVVRAAIGNIDTIVSLVLRPWAYGVIGMIYYPVYACALALTYHTWGLTGALWIPVLGSTTLAAIGIWLYVTRAEGQAKPA